MKAVSLAEVVEVPIPHIVIGRRRREKLGRLRTLAKSIAEHGLIHPILLRGTTLVAGHRRLEACRSLNWKTIPARQVARMSDDELRAIELDENTARENLTDYATSKARLAQIRQAEADLKAQATKEAAEAATNLSGEGPKQIGRNRGRPKGSRGAAPTQEAIAKETGIDPKTQRETERHVELAEQYPFMQRAGWNRTHVLDAGDQLEQLPEDDRSPIAALLDQDAIPSTKALELLKNAVNLSVSRRRAIIEHSQAEDEFVRRTALTELGQVPPPPDPGLLALHEASRSLTRAATTCRCSKFKSRLAALSIEVDAVLKAFSTHEKEARTNGSPV